MTQLNVESEDLLGRLSYAQIDHVSLGLEHSFECTLRRAGAGVGRLWLEHLPTGSAVEILPTRSVQHAWDTAEEIAEAYDSNHD